MEYPRFAVKKASEADIAKPATDNQSPARATDNHLSPPSSPPAKNSKTVADGKASVTTVAVTAATENQLLAAVTGNVLLPPISPPTNGNQPYVAGNASGSQVSNLVVNSWLNV